MSSYFPDMRIMIVLGQGMNERSYLRSNVSNCGQECPVFLIRSMRSTSAWVTSHSSSWEMEARLHSEARSICSVDLKTGSIFCKEKLRKIVGLSRK